MSKLTGKSISSSIQQRVDECSNEKRVASRDLSEIQREILDLERSQSQQLALIGKAHLAEVIAKRVNAVAPELARMFDEREAAITKLTKEQKKAHENANLLPGLMRAADQVLYRERNLLNEAYASSQPLIDARAALQAATQSCDADRRAADASLVESRQKLVDYHSSAYFQHLLGRGFGTTQYRGGFFLAWADAWIARKINFVEAKRNYETLQHLPDAARADADASIAAKEKASAVVKSLLADIEAKSGVEKASKDREAAHAKQAENEALVARLQDEAYSFKQLQDDYYEKMSGALRQILKGMSESELRIFVTATASREDDAALDNLLKAQGKILSLRRDEIAAQAEVERLAAQYRRASRLREVFEEGGYDKGRRVYNSDFDVDQMMTGFILGQLTQSSLDSMVRNSSFIEPEPARYTPPSPPGYISPSSTPSWSNSNDDDSSRRSTSSYSNAETIGGSDSSSPGYSNSETF
jgi:hypothetical protein